MKDEFSSLEKNHTWTLTELPLGKNVLGGKWIFKIKYNPDGSVERYKAKLVAKGYSQVYGVDFSKTFSPVVKLTSTRVLMALAAQNNLRLHQMDVKTPFMNGLLDEEVNMSLPEGLNISSEKNMVCKLNKSIYGLKQSSRQWYQRIDSFLLQIAFTRANAEQNVYVHSQENAFVYLALHVDDCILASDFLQLLTNFKEKLKTEFDMVDLEEIHHCLGMQVDRNREEGWI